MTLVSKVYTAVRLIFPLHNQGMAHVSYISNDPLSMTSMIDKLSKRADTGTSINNTTSVFPTIFFAVSISICGSAASIIALVAFLRTYRNDKDENTSRAMDNDEKSIRFPSTIGITLSVSCDDMGGLGGNIFPPPHCSSTTNLAKHIILAE